MLTIVPVVQDKYVLKGRGIGTCKCMVKAGSDFQQHSVKQYLSRYAPSVLMYSRAIVECTYCHHVVIASHEHARDKLIKHSC